MASTVSALNHLHNDIIRIYSYNAVSLKICNVVILPHFLVGQKLEKAEKLAKPLVNCVN